MRLLPITNAITNDFQFCCLTTIFHQNPLKTYSPFSACLQLFAHWYE